MSKPVKDMITETYRRRFEGIDGMVVVDLRGIGAIQNNELRNSLREQNIRLTVVKNSLARRAFEDTTLASIGDLLEGPCAFAYGEEGLSVVNVAREMLKRAKDVDQLELKGAVMEGAKFGPADVERLSKFPTREEAMATLLGALLGPGATLGRMIESPGAELAGAIKGPAGSLGGLLGAIRQKLEDGQAIAKVA